MAAGSIAPLSTGELRALELELKVYKHLSADAAPPKEDSRALKEKTDVDALLSFGRSASTPSAAPSVIAQAAPLVVLPEKRKGRPPGAKDKQQRVRTGPISGIALQKKLAREARENGAIDAVPSDEFMTPQKKEE